MSLERPLGSGQTVPIGHGTCAGSPEHVLVCWCAGIGHHVCFARRRAQARLWEMCAWYGVQVRFEKEGGRGQDVILAMGVDVLMSVGVDGKGKKARLGLCTGMARRDVCAVAAVFAAR